MHLDVISYISEKSTLIWRSLCCPSIQLKSFDVFRNIGYSDLWFPCF